MSKRRRDGGPPGLFDEEELRRLGTGRRPSQVGQVNIFGGVEVAETLRNEATAEADVRAEAERRKLLGHLYRDGK